MAHRLHIAAVLALSLSVGKPAKAEPLPSVDDLRSRIGLEPVIVEVIEPHLSSGENHTTVEYVGYHAEDVLSVLLGRDWRAHQRRAL